MVFILETELKERISPLIQLKRSGDISFYEIYSKSAFQSFIDLISIRKFDDYVFWLNQGLTIDNFHPGPVFPYLLEITNYFNGAPIFYSSLNQIMATVTCVIWILYLRKLKASQLDCFFVIFYPVATYYGLLVSTDMLFAFIFSILFFLLSSHERVSLFKIIFIFLFLLIFLGTRPNSIIILPIIGLYFWQIRQRYSFLLNSIFGLILLIFSMISICYYYPYFIKFSEASSGVTYWGIEQSNYLGGIFPNLFKIIDLVFSWIILAVSKVFYLCGFRPSWSGLALELSIIRSLGAIFLVPGLFYILIIGRRFEKIVMCFFLFPLLSGISQERYLLPIYPILIFYGSLFWKKVFRKFKQDSLTTI